METSKDRSYQGTTGTAGTALTCIAVAVSVFLLHEAASLLLPATIAIMLAIVLSGPVGYLHRRGIPEPIGAALVILVMIAAVVLVVAAFALPAMEWWKRVPTDMAQLLASFERLRRAAESASASTPGVASVMADPLLQDKLASEGAHFTQTVVARAAALMFPTVSTFLLLYFLLISERWLIPRIVQSAPTRRKRVAVLAMLRDARAEIRRYLLVLATLNVILGALTATSMALAGLPDPLFWGALAAALNFIPYLGPVTMFSLSLLAGVMEFDTLPAMVLPCLGFTVSAFIESSILSPWMVGHRMRISKLLVFGSVMLWGWVWGIGGTVVSTPILIALRSSRRGRWGSPLLQALFNSDTVEPPALAVLLERKNRDSTTEAVSSVDAPRRGSGNP